MRHVEQMQGSGTHACTFFAQFVPIKLVLPQAAQLSIHFFPGKSEVLHLCEGPD